MKKRVWKRITVLLLAICLLMAGCGKNTDGGAGGKAKDGSGNGEDAVSVHYKTEELNFETEGYPQSVCMGEKAAFCIDSVYNEEEQTSKNYFCSYIYETGETVRKELAASGVNTYYQNLVLGNDGKMYIMEINYPDDAETTGNYTPSYKLDVIDESGTVLSSEDLKVGAGDEQFYCQNMVVLSDGRMVLYDGSSNMIYVTDASGAPAFNITIDNWLNSMVVTKDDKVLVSYYGNTGSVVTEIDMTAKALGKTYANCPEANGNAGMVAGSDGNLYISSGDRIHCYHPDTETSELVMSWLDCDIDGDTIQSFGIFEDGSIIAMTMDYNYYGDEGTESNKVSMVRATEIPASEYKEKEILTYACMYADQDVKRHIIDFNRNNDKYRIEVVLYEDDNDWEGAMERFNNDMTSGKASDIIDISQLNLNTLASKGILEDLYPYIEKDSEIKIEDYQQQVFDAFEINDKLYNIVPSFSIQTLVGKSSLVGEEPGWTIDEMIGVIDSLDKDVMALQYGTKLSVLTSCMVADMESYVDLSTGECHFESDEFIKLLEFCNRFPKEYEWDEEAPSTPELLKDNKLLLNEIYVSDTEQYQMMEAMYNEPITMIGYPSKEGNGAVISAASATLGINSKSKNKDAAWEFIRYFMTDEYQKNVRWNFPTKTSALDAYFEKAMVNETYVDENGETQIRSKGSWGWDDFSMEMYAATEEQVNQIKELIANTNHRYYDSTEISKIIEEETGAYFDGQKSAADVAKIIQSRAQIFVNESR